ncbi:MAG: helicase associated domain-containing protein [Alphaproteobacteria bacterium]
MSIDDFDLAARATVSSIATAKALAGNALAQWWANYELLKAHYEQHQHYVFTKKAEALAAIAGQIRRSWNDGKLNEDQIAALKKINFPRTAVTGIAAAVAVRPPPADVARLVKLRELIASGSPAEEIKKEAATLESKLRTRYRAGTLSPVHAERLGLQ